MEQHSTSQKQYTYPFYAPMMSGSPSCRRWSHPVIIWDFGERPFPHFNYHFTTFGKILTNIFCLNKVAIKYSFKTYKSSFILIFKFVYIWGSFFYFSVNIKQEGHNGIEVAQLSLLDCVVKYQTAGI